LWQRSRLTDAPDDEEARFLDLAGFADGLLDADEHERVAALLARNGEAAADVDAARASGGSGQAATELENVVARACAILPDAALPRGRVIAFAPRRRGSLVQNFAQWGSIAAAIAMAGWLGFSMGSDTSLALANSHQASDTAVFPEVFDTTGGFLRDLGEGLRT
jgi:anti-sigma factor RsiW